jgi:hypothetical protein
MGGCSEKSCQDFFPDRALQTGLSRQAAENGIKSGHIFRDPIQCEDRRDKSGIAVVQDEIETFSVLIR